MVLLYKVKEVYMQDYKNLDFINNLKKTIDKTIRDLIEIKECL